MMKMPGFLINEIGKKNIYSFKFNNFSSSDSYHPETIEIADKIMMESQIDNQEDLTEQVNIQENEELNIKSETSKSNFEDIQQNEEILSSEQENISEEQLSPLFEVSEKSSEENLQKKSSSQV